MSIARDHSRPRRRATCLLAVGSVGVLAVVLAAAPPAVAPGAGSEAGPPASRRPVQRRTAPIEPERQRARSALVDRLSPEPLSRSALDAWAAELELDHAARTQLDTAYEQYRAAFDSVLDDHARSVLPRVNAAFTFDPVAQVMRPRFTPVLTGLHRDRRQSLDAAVAVERELSTVVTSLVDVSRHPDARRLTFARTWDLLAEPAGLPSAQINLVDLVNELDPTPEERALIAQPLDDYIRKMTAVLGWRSASLSELELERAEIMTELGPEWELTSTREERALVADALEELDGEIRRTAFPIGGLNRESLVSIARLLPPERGQRLQDLFFHRTAPELFSDELGLAALITLAAGMPGLSANEVDARLSILVQAQRELLPSGLELARLADEAAMLDAGDRDTAEARLQLLVDARRIGMQRRVVMARASTGIEGLLRSDETMLVPQAESYRRDLVRRDAADEWLIGQYLERLDELRALPEPGEGGAIDDELEGTESEESDTAFPADGL